MNKTVTVQVLRTRPDSDGKLSLPSRQTSGSAGLDLRAAIDDPIRIEAGARTLIPTGLALALPAGVEAQIRPRSGLALKHGVTVLNSPGTIDSDYRGEIQVLLINHGDAAFTVGRGDRIAQLVVAQVLPITLHIVDELGDTARGAGGFGHTGAS